MKAIIKHAFMLLVALALPPLYFVLRKRYKIAVVLTVIMVVLSSWHLYGVYFAMGLSFVSEIVQIGVELFRKDQELTVAYGKQPAVEPELRPRPAQEVDPITSHHQ